jgi:predicted metal-dependent hydrolase
MTKRASIFTSWRLTLNTRLLQLPKVLGEFVVVHERVHLLIPNHGRVFKSFMYAYLPDWEEREHRLQTTGQHPPPNQSTNKAAPRRTLP